MIRKRHKLWLRYQLFKLRALAHRGNKVTCNICLHSFKGFLPKGDRVDARCPHCNSLERQRWISWFVQNELASKKMIDQVLYFSPLPALQKQLESHPGIRRLISADIDPEVADTKVDITQMQFNDDQFDLLICSHVLAHIEDEEKAISETYRVIKPGGMALILTNYEEMERNIIVNSGMKQTDFTVESNTLRIHGNELIRDLESAGFTIQKKVPSAYLTADEMSQFGMRDEDIIILAKIF